MCVFDLDNQVLQAVAGFFFLFWQLAKTFSPYFPKRDTRLPHTQIYTLPHTGGILIFFPPNKNACRQL
ncbi:unnamed protein product [Meloidogyne enterolobii]|uniref:Uncharacterized protein n=1 Tax=Meloidogyne enterolobii TaxID=390850 RepID=A0ACB1AQ41_MELEN